MKLFVKTIEQYSAKANLITYTFIDTNTILDGCDVVGYAPTNVNLTANQEQEVPYFIAKGIFGFNCGRNIKSLEQQLQARAPKGQKRVWRAQTRDLFNQISALNVETPVEETGEFIGEIGKTVQFIAVKIEMIHSHDWIDHSHWKHNGYGWGHPCGTLQLWRITDCDGHTIMFKSSGTVINNKLSELAAAKAVMIEATVTNHDIFNGIRQTWVRNLKFPESLFQTLI